MREEDDLQAAPRFCCYQLDPINDPRWTQLVERHPKASVFHTVAWLSALRRTYAYEPVAFTTSPPSGELKDGIVFCRVNSWLTGRRLVSLPFSDHCEPLCDSSEAVNLLLRHLQGAFAHEHWKYVEIRPVEGTVGQTSDGNGFLPAASYFLHILDLRPSTAELFDSLDKDCVQRRIVRAERARLIEKWGRTDELLREFYALLVVTRKRHRLPPIPYAWLQNLVGCMGDFLEIRLAYKDHIPISGILTLRCNDATYYKYGCSDARFKQLGATSWLLWRAITAAKSSGAIRFDLGRTDVDNLGLLNFKNHWAPYPQRLTYRTFPEVAASDPMKNVNLKIAKRVFYFMPNALLRIIGRMLYRHIG